MKQEHHVDHFTLGLVFHKRPLADKILIRLRLTYSKSSQIQQRSFELSLKSGVERSCLKKFFKVTRVNFSLCKIDSNIVLTKSLFYTVAKNSTLKVSFSCILYKKKFCPQLKMGLSKSRCRFFHSWKNIATRLFTSHFSVKEITIYPPQTSKICLFLGQNNL